jgi:ATP-dependent helicase HrpB
VLGRESGVREGEFLVAIDVVAGRRGAGSEAVVRVASRVERDWLEPTRVEMVHALDPASGAVRAHERSCLGEIVLGERAVPPDPELAAQELARAILARGPDPPAEQLLRRLRFAGQPLSFADLVHRACSGCTALDEVQPLAALAPHLVREAERAAPATLAVPSGRRVSLEYAEDGTVFAEVKLQELFGLADTPRIGPGRVPVTFRLLAPNGRPVQTTRDLRSFWERTYPEVRRELRGRYPRHPWPEDPWSATPTARTTKRRERR